MDIKKAILDQVSTDQEHEDIDAVLAALGITVEDFASLVVTANRFADPAHGYDENFVDGLKLGLAIGIRAARQDDGTGRA
jgi:hypothetical protein